MSWIKRRGHNATNPTGVPPATQVYGTNQHSNQETSQWREQDLSANNWFNQTAAQNQQKPQYQYNPHQPPTDYWQPQYAPPNNYAGQNPPNPYQQQQMYNQHNPQQQQQQQQNYYGQPVVPNDQYDQQPPQQHYQMHNNPYSIPQQQQQLQFPATSEQDTWGNWGWGDEDNSNVQIAHAPNVNTAVADSFNAEESWNWSVDESSSSASTLNYGKPDTTTTTSLTSMDSLKQDGAGGDSLFPKMGKLADKHNNVLDNSEAQLKNLAYEPAKAPGVMKLRHSDNLTPQWSTESQMSQESSDDVLQTSESDKILSRSSTISQSPISGQEALSENLMPVPEVHTTESELKYQAQYENVEIINGARQDPQNYLLNPSVSVKSSPSPLGQNFTPPPPPSAPAPAAKINTPPPPMKIQTPPLATSQGSSDDLRNPYKRTTALSHSNIAKSNRSLNPTLVDRPQASGFQPFTQSVNLETLPDNSEQPDTLLPSSGIQALKKGAVAQLPDNNEVAPINERNQYLETGQLSDESTNQLQSVDTLPPPGLRRMVLGQIETNDTNSNVPIDEPPPGLSRMVLGQTESSSSMTNVSNQRDSGGPPIGFPRMVPGESSSPETNPRHQYQVYQDDIRHEEYSSEVEMNQLHANLPPQTRSATIGADTPPSVANPVIAQSNMNRSETIGSDSVIEDRSVGTENRMGAMGVDRENLLGANSNETRRDSVEGQDLKDLVGGVRDMTIASDLGVANNELGENSRGRSRQESSDSDREVDGNKSPRDPRDRRYRDKDDRREKNRGRYSPETYNRDRRYDRRRPRDRRYEDESDYYSDKEKDGRREERKDDYEKRYGSLRTKDKERRKREGRDVRDRRDPRDERDVRDGREYDGRRDYHRDYDRRDGRNRGDYYYYDEGYDGQRSRPSSRSDSMHESFRHERDHRRQRPRERERDGRRQRDFNPYTQGAMYDPYNPYYQQYQYYYENLRRTNPQAYLEWYQKYMQQAGMAAANSSFRNEDRGSVHSGRSSANDEMKERYDRTFDGTDSVPLKFSTPHLKASIASGKLVKVVPNYPLDGQNAVVELLNVRNFLSYDDEIDELSSFPGPLIKGITHKKTVIEYCENKIRNAAYNDNITDPSSYVLLWELMILLIRQNGVVVGTDIAELLMKDRSPEVSIRPSSVTSTSSSAVIEANTPSDNLQSFDPNSGTNLKEVLVTNKFREYLIYGSEKEALEWAMKHGLWGHALFLASRLDKRTYANVMMRFANGLTINDPLQTLYQLLSGRVPSAVTAVADEKWGDWRPHLAMILSNTTPKPELGRKAITTLADTLMGRGSIYAAQFCYLMAEVGFSHYGAESAKLVLLGSNHQKPFVQFATNEAIHLTEICEYAYSLNDAGFLILEFQPYKYLLASRLSDRGLLEKALAYLERVSSALIQKPWAAQPSLIDRVCLLADRLKYYDPLGDAEETDLNVSRPDNSWLKDLKAIQNDYNMGVINHESANNLAEAPGDFDSLQTQQAGYGEQAQIQEAWHAQQQQQQTEHYQQQGYNQWQTQQVEQEVPVEQVPQLADHQQGGFAQCQDPQQAYWQTQQQWASETQTAVNYGQTQENQLPEQDPASNQAAVVNDYWNSAQNEGSRPQITMPNQLKRQHSIDSGGTEKAPKPSPVKPKPVQNRGEKSAAKSGWFGGMFSSFGLKPKNQMKLPDDKNPSIVWDENRKKWVNLDEDGAEVNHEVRPPPKMTDMMPKPSVGVPPGIPVQQTANPPIQHANNLTAIAQNQYAYVQEAQNQTNFPGQIPAPTNAAVPGEEPPKPSQPNMFKLQRGRNLKKSYVDVFNPNGKSSEGAQNNSLLGAPQIGGAQMNFFVPAPVSDPNAPVDFLTPGNVNMENNSQTPAYQSSQ